MSAPNKVRIGAGEWRSRLLQFPDTPGLRPTPDRVRQTLFNWLGQELHGLHCLDLFSGTGVLGFEALSRGAISAVMVEKAAIAYKALQENKRLLKADAAQLLHMDAMQYLSRPIAVPPLATTGEPALTKAAFNTASFNTALFNVVFLDPPYNQGWLPKLLPLLRGLLAEQALVYVEAEYALVTDADWQVLKQGKAGNVFYHLISAV